MRMLKFVFPTLLALGVAGNIYAAEKPNKTEEVPADQTGSLTGSLSLPDNDTPKGAVAGLHQKGGTTGADTVFFLYAEGSVEKKLKDLAKNGATATVSGTITKDGYHVTSISNIVKVK